MNWFSPFGRRKTASVARERLQILLTHERGAESKTDLVPLLREEVLKVVAKHISIDPDKVQVRVEREKSFSLLEIDIEIPGSGMVTLGCDAGAAKTGRETRRAEAAQPA
jgi:cell division topological specificity factor